MDIGIISIRYAKALLRFAIDNKEEERVYAEIETLAHSFLHIPTLRQVLQDPLSDNARQVEILTCATCGNGSLSASTERFIQLVTAHNRNGRIYFYLKLNAAIGSLLYNLLQLLANCLRRSRRHNQSALNYTLALQIKRDESLSNKLHKVRAIMRCH